MGKSTFEQMGGTYHQHGHYLLPNLFVLESVSVGICGQRHLRYLKEHCKITYTAMLLSGKLNVYLAEIDQQAEELFVTERLKADCQMEWVGRRNNIRNLAIEVVNAKLINV